MTVIIWVSILSHLTEPGGDIASSLTAFSILIWVCYCSGAVNKVAEQVVKRSRHMVTVMMGSRVLRSRVTNVIIFEHSVNG